MKYCFFNADLFDKQYINLLPGRFFTDHTCRYDLCIIDHKEVSGIKIFDYIAERPVFKCPPFPVYHQQL